MDGKWQRQTRAAHNQSFFRSVNERFERLNQAFDHFTPYGSWMYECMNMECIERLDLTLAEYEAVRKHSSRVIVAPSEAHVVPEAEQIIGKTDRYWIVDKVEVAPEVAVDRGPGADG